jgi:hypothetical protein
LSESAGQPQPPVEWFAGGIIDSERKLRGYLLSSIHPDGRNKLRLWRSVFGIGEGEADLLERLIREQLLQATPVERQPQKVNEPHRAAMGAPYPALQGAERQRGAGQDRVGSRSPERSSSPLHRLPCGRLNGEPVK